MRTRLLVWNGLVGRVVEREEPRGRPRGRPSPPSPSRSGVQSRYEVGTKACGLVALNASMLSPARATTLATALDLDVDALGICHACLWFVSYALDVGDERDVRGAVRRFAPDLWEEGLALPARLALERALRRGVPAAEAAIADVDARAARSPVVQAIVRRLGADLLARTNASWTPPPGATVTPLDARRGRG